MKLVQKEESEKRALIFAVGIDKQATCLAYLTSRCVLLTVHLDTHCITIRTAISIQLHTQPTLLNQDLTSHTTHASHPPYRMRFYIVHTQPLTIHSLFANHHTTHRHSSGARAVTESPKTAPYATHAPVCS